MDGRVADDKLTADDDGVSGAGGGGAAELFEEAAGGLFANFFARVVDGGELWLGEPGYGVVIKAYDGHVFGYAEPSFLEGLQEYSSKKIIGYKSAVGACLHGEDLFGGANGSGFAEVVDQEHGCVEVQTVVCEGLFVAFKTAGVDVPVEIGGDMGDAAAALCGEMGGSFVAGFYVVDDDAGAVGKFLDAIEKYDGDAFLYKGIEVFEVGGIEGEGGDESVDAFVEEVVYVGGFFPIGFGGVADDEVVTGVGGDLFDAGQDGTDELTFYLVYDDADGMCLLHAQVAGEAIGTIAHFLGCVHDPFARFDIYGRMVF